MSILNLAFNHTSLNLKTTDDLKTSAQGKHAAVEAEKDDDGAAADVGGYCDKSGAPPPTVQTHSGEAAAQQHRMNDISGNIGICIR